MKNITGKPITLRKATATGIVFCSQATIDLIREEQLPKGNLFDVARAAGFLGAKSTPQLLPHCHPVSIDGMDIEFAFLNKASHGEMFGVDVFSRTGVVIIGKARSIGRTGIEMETLMAVSVAALEIYDMLKPIDKQLEIGYIKLLEKRGGKSDSTLYVTGKPSCAVLVCSDSVAAGRREDTSGRLIVEKLKEANADVRYYAVLRDDKEKICSQIKDWVAEDIHFIFTTGGTGLSPADVTVEAVASVIEKRADGVAEAMRNYGQMRTPFAMMSNMIAGTISQTLVLTLPGSESGARESLEAILPAIFHARKMLLGGGHDLAIEG